MEYLVLSALGENQPHLANELTKLANHCECNVVNYKTTLLGSAFVAHMQLSGTWNAIAKLEGQLASLEQKFNLHLLWQRTKEITYSQDLMPYAVYIISKDQPGITFHVTEFFSEQNINIDEIYAETYLARKTGATMVSITLSVSIPISVQLPELREQFILFCDRYNLDGVMEPEKD